MTRGRAIAVSCLLAAAALAVALWPDDPPAPSPAPEPEPPALADAAPVSDPDAGALLAAWASALQPVLKADGGAPTAALWVHSTTGPAAPNPFEVLLRRRSLVPLPDGGAAPARKVRPNAAEEAPEDDGPPEPPDAGVPPACDPGPLRIALTQSSLDVVVAIDTSGSMLRTLPLVNQWLTDFEAALRTARADYQLIVVVDLEDMRRTLRLAERRQPGRPKLWAPSDAGVNVPTEVASNDALAVLLDTAAQAQSSWLGRLREGAATHLVVVTDDNPERGVAPAFLARLTGFAGGRLGTPSNPKFKFHALLGIETSAEQWVLQPGHPPIGITASGCGVAPGVEYQALAQQTGGLRTSVCHEPALKAFTTALVDAAPVAAFCDSTLPPNFPADGPVLLRALGPGGREQRLSKAFDTFNCEQSNAGYLVQFHQLRVCPRSCQALTEAGYTWIEATGDCRGR